MIAVLRYTIARCAPSQLWAPPWILGVLAIALVSAPGAHPLDSLALDQIVLLPLATWITIATIGSEPASHRAAVAAQLGGQMRYRIGAVASAALAAFALAPLAVAWSAALGGGADGVTIAIGGVESASSVVAGAVVGSIAARPVIDRIGFTLLTALLLDLALVVIPGAPPVRTTLQLTAAHAEPSALLAIAALQLVAVLIVGSLLVIAAAWVARRRGIA